MKIQMKIRYDDYLKIHEHSSTWLWYLLLVVILIFAPYYLDAYFLYILSLSGIYSIVAMGFNILAGYAGQISLGHAAFYAIGAYSSAILTDQAHLPFWLALPLSGFITCLSGLVVSFFAFRLMGLYLAIATMAFGFIIDEIILRWESLTRGSNGYSVKSASLFGHAFSDERSYYYVILFVVIAMLFIAKNIVRSSIGRSLVAIRDSEAAAKAVGINVHLGKLMAFGISAFFAGVAGSLFAHLVKFIGPDNFTIINSILFLAMVIVGGVGSLAGAILGALVMTVLPEAIKFFLDFFPASIGKYPGIDAFVYGLTIIIFLIFEPMGLYGRWLKVRFYWEMFPFYRNQTFKSQRKFYKTEKK